MRAKGLPIILTAILILVLQDLTLRGIRVASSGAGGSASPVAKAQDLGHKLPDASARDDQPQGLDQAEPDALHRQFVIASTDPVGYYREARGIAIDQEREIVYVVDSANHRIQAHTLRGEVLAVFGGKGRQPGRLLYPMGMAVAPDGSLYVADHGNERIQHFAPDGAFLHAWTIDDPAETDPSRPQRPYDVAVGIDGTVYVVGLIGSGLLRYTSEGTLLQAWETWRCGRAPQAGVASGRLLRPLADLIAKGPVRLLPTGLMTDVIRHDGFVATAPDSSVYVGDWGINRFTSDGECIGRIVDIGVGTGVFEVPGPFDAEAIADGSLLVSDGGNQRIHRFNADGKFIESWSPPGGRFDAIAVAKDQSIFVTDGDSFRQQPSRVLRLSGEGLPLEHWGRGRYTGADEAAPRELLLMPDESLLVTAGDRLLRYTLDGAFLGAFGAAGSAPGRYSRPQGLARSPGGAVYVADTGNRRVQMLDRTLAPLRSLRALSDKLEGLKEPSDVVVLGDDGRSTTKLYVSDAGHNEVFVYHASGSVFGSRNPRAEDEEVGFTKLQGIDYQADPVNSRFEDFYYVDKGSHRVVFDDFWGDRLVELGGQDAFSRPHDIVVAREGRKRVFVSDSGNNRIRVFDHDHHHLGDWGTSGTGLGQLSEPKGLALTPDGGLAVADAGNQRVQIFDQDGKPNDRWPVQVQAQAPVRNDHLASGPDGSVHILSNSGDVAVYDADGAFQTRWQATPSDPLDYYNRIAVASDSSTFLASRDGSILRFTGGGEAISSWDATLAEAGTIRDFAIDGLDQVHLLIGASPAARIQRRSLDGRLLESWEVQGGPTRKMSPYQFALGPDGAVYVVYGYHRIIERYAPSDRQVSYWSTGAPPDGELQDIVIGPAGQVYVTARGDSAIREYDRAGRLIGRYQPSPACDGLFSNARTGLIGNSSKLAMRPDGSLLVAWSAGACVESYAFDRPARPFWNIEHHPNAFFAERPVLREFTETIDFDWQLASPDGRRVPPEGFSTRLEKQIQLENPRALAFDIRTDGGLRMWVDDQLLVDHPPAGALTDTVQVILSEGPHRLLVEYQHGEGPAWLQIVERDEGPAVLPSPTALPSATPEIREPSPTPAQRARIWLPVLRRDL